jgi:hypothetical protein
MLLQRYGFSPYHTWRKLWFKKDIRRFKAFDSDYRRISMGCPYARLFCKNHLLLILNFFSQNSCFLTVCINCAGSVLGYHYNDLDRIWRHCADHVVWQNGGIRSDIFISISKMATLLWPQVLTTRWHQVRHFHYYHFTKWRLCSDHFHYNFINGDITLITWFGKMVVSGQKFLLLFQILRHCTGHIVWQNGGIRSDIIIIISNMATLHWSQSLAKWWHQVRNF